MVFVVSAVGTTLSGGCASGLYQFGHGWQDAPCATSSPQEAASQLEIAEGKPNTFVDGVGWVLGIPGKLLLWDRRVNNHCVTPDTTEAIARYLEQNQIHDACLRINQYAPGDEWVRLTTNHEVGAGWRYTLGTLSLVRYTLLPGRVFGGDHYNPYTNSVYVYSDVPALALESAAYAKDVHGREYPGTYAAVNQLPVVSLWHDTVNTNDALAYLQATCNKEQQAEGINILYPYYGLQMGGAVAGVVGAGVLFPVGGAIVGHISGRTQTSQAPATQDAGQAVAKCPDATTPDATTAGATTPDATTPDANSNLIDRRNPEQ
jgi:hypothetical protein